MSTFSEGEPPVPLMVIGQAEAAQRSTPFARPPTPRKAYDIGASQRAVEGLREGAAVNSVAQGVGHRHRRGRDHVYTPQLSAVEAALPGRLIDQPLDDVDRLGKARPAGDADWCGVGQHGRDLQIDRRDAIDCARQMNILEGLHAAGADHICARVGNALDAQGEKAALRVERQCSLGHMVARLVVGEKNLAAGSDPLDRPADAPRRPEYQHMLGIDEILGAEPAADIGSDKPHRRRGHAEPAGRVVTGRMNALA